MPINAFVPVYLYRRLIIDFAIDSIVEILLSLTLVNIKLINLSLFTRSLCKGYFSSKVSEIENRFFGTSIKFANLNIVLIDLHLNFLRVLVHMTLLLDDLNDGWIVRKVYRNYIVGCLLLTCISAFLYKGLQTYCLLLDRS